LWIRVNRWNSGLREPLHSGQARSNNAISRQFDRFWLKHGSFSICSVELMTFFSDRIGNLTLERPAKSESLSKLASVGQKAEITVASDRSVPPVTPSAPKIMISVSGRFGLPNTQALQFLPSNALPGDRQ